jgi:hypothetical protein
VRVLCARVCVRLGMRLRYPVCVFVYDVCNADLCARVSSLLVCMFLRCRVCVNVLRMPCVCVCACVTMIVCVCAAVQVYVCVEHNAIAF